MVKKLLISLFLLVAYVATQEVFAVPAVPWPVEKVQPDGTKITVLLKGDEKVHWMESLDGYTLMYDANKFIVYAEKNGSGNLVPSKVRMGKAATPKSLQKGLRYSKEQVNTLKQIWGMTEDVPQKAFLGQKKVFVVLMDFSDREMVKTQADFDALMNQVGYTTGGAKGSVKDFYLENSYGQLDLQVTVAGPYRAAHPAEWYAPDSHGRDLALEAVDAADPSVNFADFAVGDLVETFHVIFAGYGAETGLDPSQYIWSHAWNLGGNVLRDDVRLYRYSCSPELRGMNGTNITNIGVIAHELGHVFGSPDYYDISANGGSTTDFIGTGNWDLMAGGSWNDNGRQPASINPYQKIQYGWITPQTPTPGTHIADMPASATSPVIYKVEANSNGEHYLLDNKQPIGFDASLPGHGLLIWHVAANVSNSGPNDNHPLQLYPVCASSSTAIPDNTPSSYGRINSAGCPFPGTSGKTEFTNGSTPKAFTWTGLTGISKPITTITEANQKISFDYVMVTNDPVTNLQQSESGGSVTLTWDAPGNDEVTGYKIYRDNVLKYSISGKGNTTYTAQNVPNGTYTYSVTAIYPATESEKTSVSVTVTGGSESVCLPVTNLSATASVNKVNLTWTAPFTGGWIGISGNFYNAYGWEEEYESFQGTLWNPEDLTGLEGYQISKVKFVPAKIEAGVTYDVVIYKVPAAGDPVELYSQSVTQSLTARVYNEITLTTPVAVDPSEGIIVGMKIHSMGGYYISVDNGTTYEGRNLFFDVDGWYTFEDLGIPAGQNFCLGAYLDGASGAPVMLSTTQSHLSGHQALVVKEAKANTSFLKKGKSGKQLKASNIKTSTNFEKAPAAIVKYAIYRDGVLLGDATTTSYQDLTAVQETTYSYCVSVVYDNSCTSEAVCVEATTLKPLNPYKPVENLRAEAGIADVELTWDLPYSGGTIGYSGSTINTAYRGSMDFSMAARFTVEDVQKMAGMQLQEVTFGTHPQVSAGVNPTTVAYTIRVWTGGNASGPAQLVYEQPVPSYALGWNTVALTTPVDISGYEELWIGLHAVKLDADEGVYPATADAGPAIAGKGDMIYIDGSWNTWTAYTGSANINWTILGKVGYGDGSGVPVLLSAIPYNTTPTQTKSVTSFEKVSAEELKDVSIATLPELAASAPIKYKVERDGMEIAEVTETTYTDNTVSMMTEYGYCVKAVYSGATYTENTVLSQDFETSVTGWLVRDADGDGKNWDIYNATGYAHSGTRFAMSYSYDNTLGALTPNNWLISPAITLTNTANIVELEYWIKALDADWAAEHYGVYISTTNTAISSFTLLSEETMSGISGNKAPRNGAGPELAQGSWKKRTIDLSAYFGKTVYIAFRHFDCSDELALMLDDIKVTEKILISTTDAGISDPVCIQIKTDNPYKPVETLDVKVVVSDVSLKWTLAGNNSYAPAFNVYHNDVLIAEGISEQELELTGVAIGSHTYCVEAVYEDGSIVTDAKCKTVSVVELGDPHRPVSNLQGTSNEYEGTLTWDVPEYVHKLSYHTFTGGQFNNIGTGSAADFDVAVRFTPKNLKAAEGLMLTKVKFIPVYNKATTSYSIRVWQGGSWSNSRDAGSMIVDQEVTSQTINQFNEVTLDNPVFIDPTKELWIGIRCITTTGHPAAMQIPGAIEGKGNLMYFQGAWATATELSETLNGNWIIDGIAAYHQGLDAAPIALSSLKDAENRISTGTLSTVEGFVQSVEKAAPVLPSVVKYEISREGAKIGETTELTYKDVVDASGTYTYAVTAVYGDEISSSPAEVDITYISDCDNAPENVLAVLTDNKVNVTWDYTPVVIPGESDIDVLFNEDFNRGLPATWTVLDADGDTETWYYETDGEEDGFISSDSYSFTSFEALTPDNWLITPKIDLKEGSELKYSVYSYEEFPEEHYGVYVSSTNTDPSSFTLLFEETLTASGAPEAVSVQKVAGMDKPQFNYEGSQVRTIDLSAYAGKNVYLAFRHFDCTDALWMTIDDVTVEAPKAPKPSNFNIYRNDEKIAENVNVNEYEDLLTRSGTYVYGVSFVGQSGCESAITYSDPVKFETTSLEVIVTGLSVADKVYDGTVSATIQGTAVLEGVLPGDDVTLIAGKAEFNNKNAGTDKPVTFSGFTLGGADKNKYLLAQPARVTANIEKATPQYEDLIKGLVFAGIQGKTLGDIILPEGFTWDAPQTLLSELGEQTFTVTYTPEDAGNYYIITGIPVTVVVSPGTGILAAEEGIKVYPTLLRSGEILQIESDMSENEEAVIHIFSVTGSLVKQEKVTGKYTRIQMNVAKGVYILRLQDKEVKVIVK